MKRIQKQVAIIGIYFILIGTILSTVTAESRMIKIDEIGMNITIDTELVEIVSGLKENNVKLENLQEQKEAYLQSYQKLGIVAYAVDKIDGNPNQEMLISQNKNKTYQAMPDLNTLTEEILEQYKTKFIESVEKQSKNVETGITITDHELVKTANNNTYIHILGEGVINERQVKISTYYTIMNQRLIMIGMRYYDVEQIPETEANTIEGITFESLPRISPEKATNSTNFVVGIAVIFMAGVGIILFIVRRKDKKKMNPEIKDKRVKDYYKLGGLLGFFCVLSIYQIFIRAIDIKSTMEIREMLFYKISMIASSIAIIVLSLYFVIRILQRKTDSPKKIKIALLLMGGISSILILARIIYAYVNPMPAYTQAYFKQETSLLTSILMYIGIWYAYFSLSQRVKIYYFLSTEIEEITFQNLMKKWKDNRQQSKMKKTKNRQEKK